MKCLISKIKSIILILTMFVILLFVGWHLNFNNKVNSNLELLQSGFMPNDAIFSMEELPKMKTNIKNEKTKSVNIVVIDTGASKFQESNVILFKDFVNNREELYDDNGHGTAVSGIIAGELIDKDYKYYGVSPHANLIVLKAMDEHGRTDIYTLLKAFDWVSKNREKFNINIVCLSSGYLTDGKLEDPLNSKITEIVNDNVLVITSAGNHELTYPGKLIEVLAVGSLIFEKNSSGIRYTIADNSNYKVVVNKSLKPDIYMLGVNIVAPTTRINVSHNFFLASGTSFSAAIAAGFAANILYANPTYSALEVRHELMNLFSYEKLFGLDNFKSHKKN